MQQLNHDVRDPASTQGQQRALPVWDVLRRSQSEREAHVHTAFAAAGSSPAGCVHCGWTLPHLSHAAVDAVRPMLCCGPATSRPRRGVHVAFRKTRRAAARASAGHECPMTRVRRRDACTQRSVFPEGVRGKFEASRPGAMRGRRDCGKEITLTARHQCRRYGRSASRRSSCAELGRSNNESVVPNRPLWTPHMLGRPCPAHSTPRLDTGRRVGATPEQDAERHAHAPPAAFGN